MNIQETRQNSRLRPAPPAETPAEQQQRLMADIFAYIHEGVVITDAEATIVEVNTAFCELTGYSREEALGRNPRFLQSGHQKPESYVALWRTLLEQGCWQGELWNRCKDGRMIAELLTIRAARNADGAITPGLSLKLADKLECGDFVTRSGDNHSIGFASFYRG